MSRLFLRTVELVIAQVISDSFFTTTNETTVRDLRVAFSIEKSMESTPNTATVHVWNFAESTRAELQSERIHVRLLAGYEGRTALLFAGDLTRATSVREGADMVTELTLGDGRQAQRHARVSKSFKAGANALTVFKETAKSMGLNVPSSAKEARELQGSFASGVVLSGLSSAEMSRILGARGMTWSIQDGELQVLPEGGAETVEAIVVSEDTGMVGVPSLGAAEEGKPPVLSVAKLIDPGAVPAPGRLLLVEAEQIRGMFVAKKVTHRGDTGGPDWRSDMEAIAA